MKDVRGLFRARFGSDPLVVRSPGRINLIGEHTDYNQGFVLPAAVDRAVLLAVQRSPARGYRLLASDLDDAYEADLDELGRSGKGWPDYLLGVVDQLRRRGVNVPPFDCALAGDVPIGAGMSSSAAMTAGLVFALNELLALGLDRVTLAKLAQRAENEFVGVQCGIMDQFVNLMGRAGHALRLDCHSLDHDLVPFADEGLRIVLCDTGVRHSLAASEYNLRRRQCEAGVEALRRVGLDIGSLRDVDPDMLEGLRGEIDEVVYRRCRYVIAENARVLAACRHLADGDLVGLGARMVESHQGLRDEYQVSCVELDILVEIALSCEGVLGARMMGGGFGGCTINLVGTDAIDELAWRVQNEYPRRTGLTPQVFVTRTADGTAVMLL